jgi:predicted aldo/keto reductase-like oxidoreductase
VVGPDGALEGAWEARRAGKIKHIGLSSHSLETATEAVKSGLFETIFFPLNFVTREAGEELYPLAVERDVGFMVMKPFAGGMLEDARLAFKYLLQFPQATLVTGIERTEELDEILHIVSDPAPLTEAEQREIDRLREELGNKFCRRCQYCQPCPEEVPITKLVIGESMWKRFALPNFLKIYAGAVEKVVADCTKCGECEEKCPYGLPIRAMMDEFLELYHREEARYAAWNH